MGNSIFHFQQFSIYQDGVAMKVGIDGVLLGAWAKVAGVKTVLDVGTGTGLLALMLAQRNTSIFVDAIEINKSACKVAIENVAASAFEKQINVIEASLQDFTWRTKKTYDCVITNPPFFSEDVKPVNAARRIARHNESMPFRELLKCSRKLLQPEGVLFFIYPAKSNLVLDAQIMDFGMYIWEKVYVKPTEEKEANRVLYSVGLQKRVKKEFTLCVREKGTFSKTFRELTKTYYKNLK